VALLLLADVLAALLSYHLTRGVFEDGAGLPVSLLQVLVLIEDYDGRRGVVAELQLVFGRLVRLVKEDSLAVLRLILVLLEGDYVMLVRLAVNFDVRLVEACGLQADARPSGDGLEYFMTLELVFGRGHYDLLNFDGDLPREVISGFEVEMSSELGLAAAERLLALTGSLVHHDSLQALSLGRRMLRHVRHVVCAIFLSVHSFIRLLALLQDVHIPLVDFTAGVSNSFFFFLEVQLQSFRFLFNPLLAEVQLVVDGARQGGLRELPLRGLKSSELLS